MYKNKYCILNDWVEKMMRSSIQIKFNKKFNINQQLQRLNFSLRIFELTLITVYYLSFQAVFDLRKLY